VFNYILIIADDVRAMSKLDGEGYPVPLCDRELRRHVMNVDRDDHHPYRRVRTRSSRHVRWWSFSLLEIPPTEIDHGVFRPHANDSVSFAPPVPVQSLFSFQSLDGPIHATGHLARDNPHQLDDPPKVLRGEEGGLHRVMLWELDALRFARGWSLHPVRISRTPVRISRAGPPINFPNFDLLTIAWWTLTPEKNGTRGCVCLSKRSKLVDMIPGGLHEDQRRK